VKLSSAISTSSLTHHLSQQCLCLVPACLSTSLSLRSASVRP
jgi:hypothetical protein